MAEDKYRLPRGMHPIMPEDEIYWRALETAARNRSEAMGFTRITTPVVDNRALFMRSIGTATDIVQKEMFMVGRLKDAENEETADDKEKEDLVLRPEITAQVARTYIQQGMQTLPQPVRLFYLREPVFRYERPQAGRYRQFFQYGAEILGSDDPMADVLLITLLWQIFQDVYLTEKMILEINSIGCATCRPQIKKKIVEYYKSVEEFVCPDCQKRMQANPLRLFDCKEERCQAIINEAPQIIDNLCDTCQSNFRQILEVLDDLNIPYNLNPKLVRGLDYYTRTVFELRDEDDEQRQNVLAGGGRYDGLIKELGGAFTPAVGFSIGYERVIEKLKQRSIKLPSVPGPEILIIQLGNKAQRQSLILLTELNQLNYRTACIPGKESLRGQLRMADKYKIPIVLIMGQREAYDDTVIVRDMKEGVQETIDRKRLPEILAKFLKKE